MVKDLSEKESREAMKNAIEKATEEARALSEADLKLDSKAPTGACCLYTFGVSSCTDGVTEKACRTAASNTGTMYKWKKGKSCSEISCPQNLLLPRTANGSNIGGSRQNTSNDFLISKIQSKLSSKLSV